MKNIINKSKTVSAIQLAFRVACVFGYITFSMQIPGEYSMYSLGESVTLLAFILSPILFYKKKNAE